LAETTKRFLDSGSLSDGGGFLNSAGPISETASPAVERSWGWAESGAEPEAGSEINIELIDDSGEDGKTRVVGAKRRYDVI
jgi:hypothetical protein